MLYYTLGTLASIYSVLVSMFIIYSVYYTDKNGPHLFHRKVSELCRSEEFVATFTAYSYFSLGMWIVLALPLVDLALFQKFNYRLYLGVQTSFGWMTDHELDTYFWVMFINSIGATAAIGLTHAVRHLHQYGRRATVDYY